ncbi:fructose-6-phosphate aldolase, TalC/MipB family [Chryseolinea serpens]|jgi:TalC/MipB family fructose-6-phosphate aldolase|uniref:Fructose-6-phosphate aldolase, TalC/MipB family n=1 Tax=Chryseolinea serpens TaxID=947013 RepID=A0A1M5S7I6_9BACT|nr:transaldolase family protein [Chryseolinea serpens]SHH33893.1 fructose-6-phosphate aldolase, TalC/MipB family [Chryseolinea serpens]
MELYLDSADIVEIEEAFKLGFLTGLTTTPTFMHRGGVKDVDSLIVKLSKIVPVLQIEALGDTAEEVLAEAKRQLDLGLDPKKTVFKIPVSLEGVRACNMLRREGLLVNVHLVYTLQQAYMAMQAGASYVCPLVGRLQDQGHDALSLVEQCVFAVDHYGYDTKVMFSSVRTAEHVRNALNLGVHTITAPWKIMKALTENNFTTVGTEQFVEHTRLMTVKVKNVVDTVNPTVTDDTPLVDAIVKMTEFGFGAVTVVKKDGTLVGVFTDGDLRRKIQQEGRDVLKKNLKDFEYGKPVSIEGDALLNDANALFKKFNVDTLLVTDNGKPVGMLDIQDMRANASK